MENKFYMSDGTINYFHKWFSDIYSEKYPENRITETRVKTITVVNTEECNFDCTYCYQCQKTPKILTKETAKKIVDFVLDDEKLNGYVDSTESPCVIFDFIGGEPLLNIEVLDYFVEYFKYKSTQIGHIWQTNYKISIASNGSLYRDKKVQEFLKKNKGRVSLGITIDGNKDLHDACRVYKNGEGTYDDVIKSVKLWIEQEKEIGTFPMTKATWSPENLSYLVDSLIHLFNLGITVVPANVVFEDVWSIQDAKSYYKLLKELSDRILDEEWYKTNYCTVFSEQIGTPIPESENSNWCGGDGKMMAFDTECNIYPCLRYMKYCFSTPDRKPLIIGNIDTKVGNSPCHCKAIDGLNEITRRSQSTEKCFNCPVARGCAWCSAFNYDIYGTANKRTTFHCEMHQARVLANTYFWNKLYDKLNILKSFPLHLPKEWALNIIDGEEYKLLKKMSE